MITTITSATLLALSAAAMLRTEAHARAARRERLGAAASARRCAECVARDPAPSAENTVSPRRLAVVHTLDEARERLVDGAISRHPQSSPPAEETVPPAHVDALRAPGRTPKS